MPVHLRSFGAGGHVPREKLAVSCVVYDLTGSSRSRDKVLGHIADALALVARKDGKVARQS